MRVLRLPDYRQLAVVRFRIPGRLQVERGKHLEILAVVLPLDNNPSQSVKVYKYWVFQWNPSGEEILL